jgi:DNA polymerase-3 subunit epsilon
VWSWCGPGLRPGACACSWAHPRAWQAHPPSKQIAPQVGALLGGRVLVAHNAQFDYDFLAHEFVRVRSGVPVSRRLCTLALNRLIAPATPNLKLGKLAAHYGVRQERAHDAQDDVRVLAGVLRGSLDAAGRLDLDLPLRDVLRQQLAVEGRADVLGPQRSGRPVEDGEDMKVVGMLGRVCRAGRQDR